MNWEAIGAIGEIGGALVVIITHAYLARQIRQSNQIATAQTEISVRNSLNQINDAMFTDTGAAELLIKASDPGVELSDVESLKLYHMVMRGLNQWWAIETAYKNNMVPSETYGIIFDDIQAFLEGFPGVRPICRQAIDNYPAMAATGVFTHMDKLLSKYEI